MRYRVRTVDGELFYEGLYDVEKAWRQGLVGPEDEILEEGQSLGVLAKDHPHLSRAPGAQRLRVPKTWLQVGVACLLALAAGVTWTHRTWTLPTRATVVGTVVVLLLMVLSSITVQAARRPRR